MTADPADGEPLARQVARAVRAVPGVVDLDGGAFGEIATYLPGERVRGVQLADDAGAVHIVVDLRHDLRRVAAQAADAAADLTGLPFSVTVADVAVPDMTGPDMTGPDMTGPDVTTGTPEPAARIEGESDE